MFYCLLIRQYIVYCWVGRWYLANPKRCIPNKSEGTSTKSRCLPIVCKDGESTTQLFIPGERLMEDAWFLVGCAVSKFKPKICVNKQSVCSADDGGVPSLRVIGKPSIQRGELIASLNSRVCWCYGGPGGHWRLAVAVVVARLHLHGQGYFSVDELWLWDVRSQAA